MNFDAGDLLHLLVEALDMLNVDRRNDADPRIENLHYVLPPLGVLTSLDIGVSQLVNDHDLGMQVDDALRIHLLELLAFVKELAARNERKPCDEGFRFRTTVRFNVSDTHIDTCIEQLVCLLQHPVGFAHTGAHADIDLKLAAMRLLDQIEKVLGTSPGVMCIHGIYILNENPPTKLTSSSAGFQIRLVKSPIFIPPAPLISQFLPALRKTFCT